MFYTAQISNVTRGAGEDSQTTGGGEVVTVVFDICYGQVGWELCFLPQRLWMVIYSTTDVKLLVPMSTSAGLQQLWIIVHTFCLSTVDSDRSDWYCLDLNPWINTHTFLYNNITDANKNKTAKSNGKTPQRFVCLVLFCLFVWFVSLVGWLVCLFPRFPGYPKATKAVGRHPGGGAVPLRFWWMASAVVCCFFPTIPKY